jgi:plasmid stabilization system protein ParE
MKLRFTRRAAQDLADIANYLRSRSPGGAANVRAAIFDSLQTLTEFPFAGRLQSVGAVRKTVTRKYSYLIYYEISPTSNAIVVITIQHSSRKREFEDN